MASREPVALKAACMPCIVRGRPFYLERGEGQKSVGEGGVTMSGTPDYISGGYFLAKLFRRADWKNPDLVPEAGVSISTCITEVFPRSLYTNEPPSRMVVGCVLALGVLADRRLRGGVRVERMAASKGVQGARV